LLTYLTAAPLVGFFVKSVDHIKVWREPRKAFSTPLAHGGDGWAYRHDEARSSHVTHYSLINRVV
jgi:hypothetical protein